jgi:hypothetical protein
VRLALNKKWETLLKNNYKNKNGWRYDSSGRQEQVSEFNPNITKKKKRRRRVRRRKRRRKRRSRRKNRWKVLKTLTNMLLALSVSHHY